MRRATRERAYTAMRRAGGFTARGIADECGIGSVWAVRRLIYRMEDEGMVEWVRRDPVTDRAMRWQLTPSGVARIERGTAG